MVREKGMGIWVWLLLPVGIAFIYLKLETANCSQKWPLIKGYGPPAGAATGDCVMTAKC